MENRGKMKFGENILKISEYFEEKKKEKQKRPPWSHRMAQSTLCIKSLTYERILSLFSSTGILYDNKAVRRAY